MFCVGYFSLGVFKYASTFTMDFGISFSSSFKNSDFLKNWSLDVKKNILIEDILLHSELEVFNGKQIPIPCSAFNDRDLSHTK